MKRLALNRLTCPEALCCGCLGPFGWPIWAGLEIQLSRALCVERTPTTLATCKQLVAHFVSNYIIVHFVPNKHLWPIHTISWVGFFPRRHSWLFLGDWGPQFLTTWPPEGLQGESTHSVARWTRFWTVDALPSLISFPSTHVVQWVRWLPWDQRSVVPCSAEFTPKSTAGLRNSAGPGR